MSLSTLPDLCLLMIFERIPIQQVNPLGHVCRRWNTFRPIVCNRRRSLILLVSPSTQHAMLHFERNYCNLIIRNAFDVSGYVDKRKFIAQCKFSLLKLSTLEENGTNWLIGTFPSITKLAILHDGYNEKCDLRNSTEAVQLITLLNNWSGNLKSLHYFHCGNTLFEYNPALFEAINSMPALKQLWFKFHLDPRFDHSQIDLHVLTQLNQFYSFSYYEYMTKALTCALQKYSSRINSDLKIAIRSISIKSNLFAKFCQFDKHLSKKIVEFEFYLDLSLMKKIYSKFTSLSKVSFNMHNVKLSQLCLSLSGLENLSELNLYTNKFSIFKKPFGKENKRPSRNFPPLTSVHSLELRLFVNSHSDLNSIHLPNIFPNVQWLYINKRYGHNCAICDFKYNDFSSLEIRTNQQYQSCFEQLIQPFRMLPKVEKITDAKD